MTWLKGTGITGKYPKKAFSGVLVAAYPSENNNGTKLLKLDFENEVTVGIYGVGKAQILDDEVTVAGSLAEFQASLGCLGYNCFWGIESGEIMGFKTEPDIIGQKLFMEPLEEPVIGDDTQNKKSLFWGIVTKVEKITKKPGKYPHPPAPTKPVTPPAPETSSTTTSDDIISDIVGVISKPMTVTEIFIHFKRKHKVHDISATLSQMESDGIAVQDNKKWVLV